MAFSDNKGIKKREQDESGLESGVSASLKPQQALDYKRWRQEILPQLVYTIGQDDMIEDEVDDLWEFEDIDIFNKESLDIRVIHIYLHNLDHYYGSADGDTNFIIQIQYGRRKNGGKFEVKHFTDEEDPNASMDGTNLQYYWHLKYASKWNMIKVKMMSTNGERICHAYVDLHGLERGKFIHLKRPMNSKEYSNNAESKLNMTQLKLSLFLEGKK